MSLTPSFRGGVAGLPPLVLSFHMGDVDVRLGIEMMQCRKLKELGLLGPASCGASEDDRYATLEDGPALRLPGEGIDPLYGLVGKRVEPPMVALGLPPSGYRLVYAHLAVLHVIHELPYESEVLADRRILDAHAAPERDIRVDVIGGEVLGRARLDLPILVEGIEYVGELEQLAPLLRIRRFGEVVLRRGEVVLHIDAELVLRHRDASSWSMMFSVLSDALPIPIPARSPVRAGYSEQYPVVNFLDFIFHPLPIRYGRTGKLPTPPS